MRLSTFCEIAGEEFEKGLHLDIKGLDIVVNDGEQCQGKRTNLFGGGFVYSGDETMDLIAHSLGSNTGGGGLEVDMTGTANTGIEGVGTGHQGGRHALGR
jgi:hypothetical protein